MKEDRVEMTNGTSDILNDDCCADSRSKGLEASSIGVESNLGAVESASLIGDRDSGPVPEVRTGEPEPVDVSTSTTRKSTRPRLSCLPPSRITLRMEVFPL